MTDRDHGNGDEPLTHRKPLQLNVPRPDAQPYDVAIRATNAILALQVRVNEIDADVIDTKVAVIAIGRDVREALTRLDRAERRVRDVQQSMPDAEEIKEVVADVVEQTGKHRSITPTKIRAVIAETKNEEAANELRQMIENRRKLRDQVIGGVVVGVILLIAGILVGRAWH